MLRMIAAMRMLVMMAFFFTPVPGLAEVNVSVMINDYYTDLVESGEYEFYDRIGTLQVGVNFYLAAKHFNERNSSIVPILGSTFLQSCDKKINVIAACDDHSQAVTLISQLNEYANEIHAAVGIATSSSAIFASPAFGASDKPVVSHWASSPVLTDKSLHPRFARTFSNDADTGRRIVDLLVNNYGYKRFALVYDRSQTGMKDVMQAKVDTFPDVTFTTVSFSDEASLLQAFVALDKLSINIVICHALTKDVKGFFGSAAKNSSFLTGEKMFIFTDFDRSPFPSELLADANLMELYKGAHRVSSTTRNNSLFETYISKYWSSFETEPATMNALRSIFAPRGSKSSYTQCKNSNVSYDIPNDMFSQTVGNAFNVMAIAYDAMLSIGIASCSVANVSNGTALYEAILNMNSFQGLSGEVKFNSVGDRDPSSLLYQLENFDGTGNVSIIGVYNDSLGKFVLTQSPYFREGKMNAPLDIAAADHDHDYLAFGLKVLGLAEVIILVVLIVFGLVWLMLHQRAATIARAQPMFLYFTLLGLLSTSFSILGLVGDDNPQSQFQVDQNYGCMITPFMFFLGWGVALSALLGKYARVYTVFFDKGIKTGISIRVLLGLGFCFTMVQLILLLGWQYSPYRLVWVREVVDVNKFDQPTSSVGYCAFDNGANGAAFLVVLCLMCLVLLVLVRIVAERVRHVPGDYQESYQIRLLTNGIIQLIALAIPCLVAVYTTSVGRFIVMSSVVFLSVLFVLYFLFFYNIRTFYRKRKFAQYLEQQKHSLENSLENPSIAKGETYDMWECLQSAIVQEKFKSYCERHYLIESYHFLLDVLSFEKEFGEMTDSQRHEKAVAISNMYIREGALLQVNIDGEIGQQVMRAVHQNTSPEKHVFDPAKNDVGNLMKANGWRAFIMSGGMYNVDLKPKQIRSDNQTPKESRTPLGTSTQRTSALGIGGQTVPSPSAYNL